ncbi:hypothetical protein CCMSSC00406_0005184 [Pleurotus cornucopiae]|uniref:Uncharacterized protein n=1 Tax=Pleurotus cornucopiae TaxID=5321 RepID=A0ACB7II21_PLECO|nr:hypothetical protein CCMSSC00406_0005184 [Pleurotus cornucopiae]
MIKSIAIAFTAASVVLAQSSASSAAGSQSTSTSPLIPKNISSACTSFLTDFNQDTSLNACTAPLISATQAFAPGGQSTGSPTNAQIVAALNTLCAAGSSTCSDDQIRSHLANFYSACSAELTSQSNPDVVRTYDVLYMLKPLQGALCTKNDNGDFCATKAKLPGSTSAAPSGLSNAVANTGPAPVDYQKYLYSEQTLTRRAPAAALIPNTTTYSEINLPFLFLSPNDPTETLCTSCTRSILVSYINFESSVPYAPGLAASPMLNKQPALYTAITDKCGSNFLGGAVQAAGGLKGGFLDNGAPRVIGGQAALSIMALVLGATAVTTSFL